MDIYEQFNLWEKELETHGPKGAKPSFTSLALARAVCQPSSSDCTWTTSLDNDGELRLYIDLSSTHPRTLEIAITRGGEIHCSIWSKGDCLEAFDGYF